MSYATQTCERAYSCHPAPVEPRQRDVASGSQMEWYAAVAALGPMPKRALQAFIDMGMSDDDVARYHSIPRASVSRMRRMWDIQCLC